MERGRCLLIVSQRKNQEQVFLKFHGYPNRKFSRLSPITPILLPNSDELGYVANLDQGFAELAVKCKCWALFIDTKLEQMHVRIFFWAQVMRDKPLISRKLAPNRIIVPEKMHIYIYLFTYIGNFTSFKLFNKTWGINIFVS